MAQLVERVVGGVGDVVDGARAQQLQALAMCSGEGPIFTSRTMRAVYRAQPCGVFDDDGECAAVRRMRLLSSRPEAARFWPPEWRDLLLPAASAQPASARRRRSPRPRAPRRSDSWRPRGWWSGPSRRWSRLLLGDGLHRDAGRGQVFGELTVVGPRSTNSRSHEGRILICVLRRLNRLSLRPKGLGSVRTHR